MNIKPFLKKKDYSAWMSVLIIILMVILASCSVSSRDAAETGPGEIASLQTTYGVQQARVFISADSRATSRLFVVLHGDAPHGPPSYQYAFAEKMAETVPGSVVAALLRPGYSDPTGLRSAGRRGFTSGDNYTPTQLNTVAQAIEELRNRYNTEKVIIIGHSGGAAIAANLMGREPKLAQASVLLSCPCDLKQWREHMSNSFGGLSWWLPVRSVSPLFVAGDVSGSSQIQMIVGANDSITPPELSRKYADTLMQRGLDIDLAVLPDRGHEILNDEAVLNHIKTFLGRESQIE